MIEYLNQNEIVMDKVMIFTDTQLWNSWDNEQSIEAEWVRYKQALAPDAKLYLFDLAGYGAIPLELENNDVYLIGGWSDKVFPFR